MAALIGSRSRLCKDIIFNVYRVNVHLVRTYKYDVFDSDRTSPKRFREIPGPSALPVVGNIWKYYLGRIPLETMPLIYEGYLKDYGHLVKEHVFLGRTLVHVFHPLDMQQIYSLDSTNFPFRISHRSLDKYRRSRKNMYRSVGLASSNAEQWSEIRKAFGPGFLSKSSEQAFEQVTDDLLTRINSKVSVKTDGVDLLPLLLNWSFECMGVLTLGKRLGCLGDSPDHRLLHFLRCIHDSHEAVFHTENLPPLFTRKYYKKLVRAQDYLYSFLKSHVNEVLYQWMHSSNTENSEREVDSSPVKMSKSVAWKLASQNVEQRDIMTMIIDMFQGGIFQTAHTLAFALYHLAINPEEQNRIRTSLIEEFPNPKDRISSRPVDQKVWNAISETMRLNPATIGTGRVLPEPLVLSGYEVPKGTICILHHQLASKQADYFESPEAFIPDRYNKADLTNAEIVANSPFAVGKRSCPGKDIALTETAIGLSKILRNFEVSYKHEEVGTKNCLLNEPDGPIKMTFTPTGVPTPAPTTAGATPTISKTNVI